MFNLFAIVVMVSGILLYKYVINHQLRLMMKYDILPVLRVKYKIEFILKYVYPCVDIVVIINSLIK